MRKSHVLSLHARRNTILATTPERPLNLLHLEHQPGDFVAVALPDFHPARMRLHRQSVFKGGVNVSFHTADFSSFGACVWAFERKRSLQIREYDGAQRFAFHSPTSLASMSLATAALQHHYRAFPRLGCSFRCGWLRSDVPST